ncbi:unnamed protein product [Cochlearia groenlandica]
MVSSLSVYPSIELKSEISLCNLSYDPNDSGIFKIFHCDGLLLCTTETTRLLVWNPCTHHTGSIQTKSIDHIFTKYALGYENNVSHLNYTILRYLDYEENFMLGIYEFNSNSWRVLDIETMDFGLDIDGVSLKGNTYWIASDKLAAELGNEFLISFDFTTEKFGPHEEPHDLENMIYIIGDGMVREENIASCFIVYTISLAKLDKSLAFSLAASTVSTNFTLASHALRLAASFASLAFSDTFSPTLG